MKLQAVVISTLVVCMIILGGLGFISDVGDNYGKTADTDLWNNTNIRLNTQQDLAQDLSNEINSFKLDNVVDFLAIPYKMIKIAWKLIKLLFNSWSIVVDIIIDSSEISAGLGIPLPAWLIPTITAIILVMVASIVVYGLFKWRFES